MTRATAPPLLAELQNASSVARQTQVLKRIKNEIIGHDLRKRSWIAAGIVPALATILSTARRSHGKRSSREMSEKGGHTSSRPPRLFTADEEASYIQATVIVGVLAKSGSIFVHPILQGRVAGPLLALLSSGASSSSALIIAILKTLNTIADRLPAADLRLWPENQDVTNLLYSKEYVACLPNIICQDPVSASVQQSIELAALLIIKTCNTEKQRDALTSLGLLEALATKVSSFVVSQGFVLPGAGYRPHNEDCLTSLPPPASSGIRLATLLHLSVLLIDGSKVRAQRLLNAPAFDAVFPKPRPEFSPSDVKKTPWGSATYLSGTAVPRYAPSNPIDSLLPQVSIPSARLAAEQANFPPLTSTIPISRKGTSFLSGAFALGSADLDDSLHDEDEHSAIAWLICVVRSESHMTRLMAIKLLAVLFRLGLARKSRAIMFGLLLVPLIVRMLDKDYAAQDAVETASFDVIPGRLIIKEETPTVLAMLLMDSRPLQKAAVEADAIKVLAQLLKESFDPVQTSRQSAWNPEKGTSHPRARADRSLGEPGPSPIARHVMRHREGVLKALASLAPFDDDYRKIMCDQGVVPCIIDALKPYGGLPGLAEHHTSGPSYILGNPPATLLAACAASQALTRSVSVLRTSWVDAGIAPPLFHLMSHPDHAVQVAATKVVCNLAMDFSPMKEAIVSHGIVKILCSHAHSAHPMLRLDSVWALKHLVYNLRNDLKINIIQELNPAWIKHLMATDPEDITPGSIIGQNVSSGSVADESPRIEPGSSHEDVAQSPVLKGHRETAGRRAEVQKEDYSVRSVKEDVMIQAQVLDLVRNLILGEGADEIVEYLFKEFKQKEFFGILAQRLRPRSRGRSLASSGGKRSSSKSSMPPTEIINAVLAIIIHIAAALPKYRSLVIHQTEIMRLVLGMFGHTSREVRRNAIWIVINLMYHDDTQDKIECRRRARDLEQLGFFDRIKGLEEDADIDVKERTKTALTLFGDLLRI